MVIHGKEIIFEQVDHTGGITVYILTSGGKSNKTQNLFCSLIPEVLVVGDYKLVVPRQMEFRFVDGSTINFLAERLDSPEYENGRYFQSALYVLNNAQVTALKNKSLSYIQITDTRQGKSIKCQPYKDLVKEQINCVLKEF